MISHIILRIRAVGIGLLIILTVIAEGQETWNLDKFIEEAITNNIQLHRVGIYMSDASVEQKME